MSNPEPSAVAERIRKEVAENPVVLYMKGTAELPQCGFSATVVRALELTGVAFRDVDVLQDPELRQGVKDFTDWPTIPQLYVKGEFVGGADIVREMFEADELADYFSKRGIAAKSPTAAA